MAIVVRPLGEPDRPWVRSLIEEEWGLPVVTPTGTYASPESHEGVVAEIDGARAGAVTYLRRDGDWEIVTVISTAPGAGAGRAMLERVRELGEAAGAERLWLITTDDTGAAPFYEHLGMIRTRTHENFVDVVRRAKPSAHGFDDAFEFEWPLGRT